MQKHGKEAGKKVCQKSSMELCDKVLKQSGEELGK